MQAIADEIIRKASDGDIAAFEELYNHFSSYVYTIAFRVIGNRELAEEVTQDAFIKIYEGLKAFGFRSQVKTWIYRITVNTAINYYKRNSKEIGRRSDFDDAVQHMPSVDLQRTGIDKEHNEALIKRLLKVLNPEQRACVVLRDIEGLSYQEIADTLRININTVRSRLKRAREALMQVVSKGVIRNEV